jgi:hypothetical protein
MGDALKYSLEGQEYRCFEIKQEGFIAGIEEFPLSCN